MKNVEKYERGYYMPPVKCMKWAEKEYVDHGPERRKSGSYHSYEP